jgi:hypothetical protein
MMMIHNIITLVRNVEFTININLIFLHLIIERPLMLPVPLPHALSMWTLDVLLHNLLPPAPAQPAPKEALNNR